MEQTKDQCGAGTREHGKCIKVQQQQQQVLVIKSAFLSCTNWLIRNHIEKSDLKAKLIYTDFICGSHIRGKFIRGNGGKIVLNPCVPINKIK